VAETSFSGWLANFSTWYLEFVLSTAAYVAFAATLHALALGAAGLRQRVHG
jgi:hypothetical protein